MRFQSKVKMTETIRVTANTVKKSTSNLLMFISQPPASSRLLLNAVMQLNHTILEAINGVQIQGHVTMTPRYQWDAVPNENGGHTDDELVDRLRVKKRGDDLATAHQPDILARLLSKAAHEWADCIVHDLHA